MNAMAAGTLAAIMAMAALTGCERTMRNMYDQPRNKTYSANPMFANGASARMPPDGTVARTQGTLADTSSARLGEQAAQRQREASAASSMPYPVTEALLRRGRERYGIYCLPCHSPIGDGDGRVVRRGFPAPPSYHDDRLRSATDRYLYDVVTRGYGIMAPYGDRIEPADRWAIVAFVRALQLSQHASVDDLPPSMRESVRRELAQSSVRKGP